MPQSSTASVTLPGMRTRAAVVLALGLLAATVAVVDATPSGSRGPERRLYWGAWISSQLTGRDAPFDMRAVHAFERLVGKRLSIVNWSSPFADCRRGRCRYYRFQRREFEAVRRHGAIPFFSWANDYLPLSRNQPGFRLRDVIAGRHDRYIRGWARAAARWGHPFFLRFDWEMNGDWFPWSEGVNGNRPGELVAAWRHVHDLFAREGARNATWVWCPWATRQPSARRLRSLYPGDAYVDWTCLDGYNWHPPWRSFERVFRPAYRALGKVAPGKPVIIGETASTERGGSKAAWIAAALGRLQRAFPRVHGFLWFERYDSGMDWPVETSDAAVRAFARGIARPEFLENRFRRLPPGRIPPPGGAP